MLAFAKPAHLSCFLFYGLLSVAPYCVPGGVKVVSEVRGLHVAGSLRSTDDSPRKTGTVTEKIGSRTRANGPVVTSSVFSDSSTPMRPQTVLDAYRRTDWAVEEAN